jgi:hypothetical protein
MQAPGSGAMPSKKARSPITADEVPSRFDDACISNLASIVRLPAGTDLNGLASDVRAAATTYAIDVREPDANELHHEIEAFYRAAERREYQRAAALRKNLSPQALAHLTARLNRPGPRAAGLKLPSPEDLLDTRPPRPVCRGKSKKMLFKSTVLRRDQACGMVETICRRRRYYPRLCASIRKTLSSDAPAAAART